ncbi:MAG TPA: HIT family protein [Pyrinomonadaceae bacterium]|jgi:histidine triad (HIT) family protein
MSDDKSNFWEPCWACRIVAGERVGSVVTETEQVLVLINPYWLTAGHALVVPRRHVENLYELPDELAAPVLSAAARVARAQKRAFAAAGVTLRQNNEAASDQHLFHFHLHVIPRFNGDLARFNAAPALVPSAEQEAAAARLRLFLEPL